MTSESDKPPTTCMSCGQDGLIAARGVCWSCYQKNNLAVRCGEAEDDDLVVRGLWAPKKKTGRPRAPKRRADR